MSRDPKNKLPATGSKDATLRAKAFSTMNLKMQSPPINLSFANIEKPPQNNTDSYIKISKSIDIQNPISKFEECILSGGGGGSIPLNNYNNAIVDKNLNDITNLQNSKLRSDFIGPNLSPMKDNTPKSSNLTSLKGRGQSLENMFFMKSNQLYEPENILPSFREIQYDSPKKTLGLLEARLLKIEQRLETNESLIHLHDEMTRLKTLETKKSILQEENFVNEVYSRLDGLEGRVKIIEDMVTTHKVEVEVKIDEFTKKIENYLQKLIQNAQYVTTKFDTLATTTISEDKVKAEKLYDIEKKMNEICDDLKDKFKNIYLSLEEQGKVSAQSLNIVSEERNNVSKLEDDFIKILTALKEFDKSKYEFNWLSDEIINLKNKQSQILSYLNLNGTPMNNSISMFNSGIITSKIKSELPYYS